MMMVIRVQKPLVGLHTGISSNCRAIVNPSRSLRLGRPTSGHTNNESYIQTISSNSCNCFFSQSITRRGISKAARRRNSKRYATFFHPPYLATPEYSQAGHDLVHSFEHYTLFNTVDEVNEWAQHARHDLQLTDRDDVNATTSFTSYWHPRTRTHQPTNGIRYTKSPLFVGLDVGWNFHMNTRMRAPTHTLHVSLPLHKSNDSNDGHLDTPYTGIHDATPNQSATTAPLVASLHLTGDGLQVHDANDFPHELRRLLQHSSLLVCGLKINRDLARLARKMDVHVDQRVELDVWAKELTLASKNRVVTNNSDGTNHEANNDNNVNDSDNNNSHNNGPVFYRSNPLVPKVIDMAHLCRHFLTPPVEIEPTIGQDADYTPTTNNPHNQSLLPKWLIQYGAVEAWHSRLLAEAMYQRHVSSLGDSSLSWDKRSSGESVTVSSRQIDEEPPSRARKKRSPQQEWEHQLHVGLVVEIYFDGKLPVGLGVVEFIGGRDGIARKWGNLIVNRGKVLVRITRVDQPRSVPTFNAHTAHLHLSPGQPMPWDGKVRLQDVFFSTLPLVACPTMNLKRPSEGTVNPPESVNDATTVSASATKSAKVSVASSTTKTSSLSCLLRWIPVDEEREWGRRRIYRRSFASGIWYDLVTYNL